MASGRWRKPVILLTAVLVIVLAAALIGGLRGEPDTTSLLGLASTDALEMAEGSYGAVLTAQSAARYAGETFAAVLSDGDETVGEGERAVYELTAPADALYNIEVTYTCQPGATEAPEHSLTIDGKAPFDEAYTIVFPRLFTDIREVKLDMEGNQIRYQQEEQFLRQVRRLADKTSFYREPFLFHLTAGKHTLELEGKQGGVTIHRVAAAAPAVVPTYAEYRSRHQGEVVIEPLRFESEEAAWKTAPNIRPEWSNDPKSSPQSTTRIRMNAFGGPAWKDGGQTAAWEVSVEKTGYYRIGFRYAVPKNGAVTYRTIRVDGDIPFDLLQEYPLLGTSFSADYLRDEQGEPLLIWLEAGRTHTISMEAKVGPVREVVALLQEAGVQLDGIFRQVTLITASVRDANGKLMSDRNRDFDLEKKIPGLIENLTGVRRLLDKAKASLLEKSLGQEQSDAQAISRALDMVDRFLADTEMIPHMLNELSNTMISINNSVDALQQVPLYLDYMVLGGETIDKRKSSVWDNLGGSLVGLADTFLQDYRDLNMRASEDALDVWVSRGRDWANIIQQLAYEDFSEKYGIEVHVNVLPLSSDYIVLTAYSGGNAPDISMGMAQGTPVEFAARGALAPLSGREGFQELTEQLVKGTLRPFMYKDQVYALPETADFQVLFYRRDIFEELKLKVPETWEEVYRLLPYLQENGMDFYYPSGAGGLPPFILQMGGQYYNDDGTQSAMDSPTAIEAFTQNTDLFNKYKIPLAADLFQRMRMGTIPIGVGGYDVYTKLQTAAPELTGKWALAPLPGMRKEDGAIDRSAPAGTTCVVVTSACQKQEQAWQFVRWWLDSATQTAYGREVETLLGAGSRWNTSNIEAMKNLSWRQADMDVILRQWESVINLPTILGGYYSDRQLLTAWNRNVIDGVVPRIAMEDAVRNINRELTRKQLEFQ